MLLIVDMFRVLEYYVFKEMSKVWFINFFMSGIYVIGYINMY